MIKMNSGKILISTLGLTDRDITFLKNLFRLGAKQLYDYILLEEDSFDIAHVVLVNADSRASVNTWNEKRLNQKAIMISSDSSRVNNFRSVKSHHDISNHCVVSNKQPTDSQIVVHRPLVFKKILEALKKAVSQLYAENNNSLRVLVVDDSFPIRKYLGIMLPELSPYPLIMDYAESGESALALINERPYDLVFLDVIMPGIDGYQVCKKMKLIADAFVVMLTSKSSPFDRVRGTMSGCDSYITKPPRDDKLASIFAKMLVESAKAV